MARFRDGDRDAFGVLIDRHAVRVHRFLVGWLRREDLAEEIAQAAMVKAAVRIDQLAEGQAFLSWLLTIARTTGLDHLRRNPVERSLPLERAEEPASSGERSVAIDVRRVLDALSADDREILLLSDYLGMPVAEVATTLNIGTSAAKMRIQRARLRFRERYETEAA